MKSTPLILAFALLLLFITWDSLRPQTITIKKSSDSDWEYSKEQMPDTTITDTLVLNGVKVFPTVQYLNIKIK